MWFFCLKVLYPLIILRQDPFIYIVMGVNVGDGWGGGVEQALYHCDNEPPFRDKP